MASEQVDTCELCQEATDTYITSASNVRDTYVHNELNVEKKLKRSILSGRSYSVQECSYTSMNNHTMNNLGQ